MSNIERICPEHGIAPHLRIDWEGHSLCEVCLRDKFYSEMQPVMRGKHIAPRKVLSTGAFYCGTCERTTESVEYFADIQANGKTTHKLCVSCGSASFSGSSESLGYMAPKEFIFCPHCSAKTAHDDINAGRRCRICKLVTSHK
jgi:hypothetical protein